jgi:hypothetical protein
VGVGSRLGTGDSAGALGDGASGDGLVAMRDGFGPNPEGSAICVGSGVELAAASWPLLSAGSWRPPRTATKAMEAAAQAVAKRPARRTAGVNVRRAVGRLGACSGPSLGSVGP